MINPGMPSLDRRLMRGHLANTTHGDSRPLDPMAKPKLGLHCAVFCLGVVMAVVACGWLWVGWRW